jgi:dipeptidase D
MAKQTELSTIESLEPAGVWQFFAGIAATPHESKKETLIRKHVRSIADAHNLAVREDEVGNLVIQVPATPGHENAPITVLQGHLDMVCEKNTGTQHDFDRDPLKLIVETEPESGQLIVRADGTTLGADNGIGVAMGLAAATSPDMVHGPLELLFTTDEEAGMTGAKALMPDLFHGRRLLNLDSEEDNAIYIGCAGGCDINLTWDLETEPIRTGDETARLVVAGLRGGHSGGDIHEGRGSAIKLLARTLLRTRCDSLRIARLTGGSKRNAIPREADAIVTGSAGMLDALDAAAKEVQAEAARESVEKSVTIRVERVPVDDGLSALRVDASGRLLTVLAALPHGVLGMHPTVPGLVETSNNVATIQTKTDDGDQRMHIEIGALARSSSASRMQEAVSQLIAVGRLGGAAVETGNDYPGWEPNLDSPMLATCRRLYKELFSEEPEVMAIHAGLECGIIGERIGNMDMVSFGPTIMGAHSPDERVYVASVQKTWRYLTAVLAELARG